MAQSREGAGDAVLGIIGVGGLAGFVVEGLRRAGDEREVLLSPRGAAHAAQLAKRFGCRVAADNQAVVDGAALVIIATPPAAVLSCLSALSWREGQAMICVAIDVTRATLAKAAPGALVLRAMPSNARHSASARRRSFLPMPRRRRCCRGWGPSSISKTSAPSTRRRRSPAITSGATG